jgi:coenzyme PQQ precursor peptide PqqA
LTAATIGQAGRPGNLPGPTRLTCFGAAATVRPRYRMEAWMTWKTPKIVEIAVGAEINCYACAEKK